MGVSITGGIKTINDIKAGTRSTFIPETPPSRYSDDLGYTPDGTFYDNYALFIDQNDPTTLTVMGAETSGSGNYVLSTLDVDTLTSSSIPTLSEYDGVLYIEKSPNGQYVAIARNAGTYGGSSTVVFDTSDYSIVAQFGTTVSKCCTFSPDGQYFAYVSSISSGEVYIYNTSDWSLQQTHTGFTYAQFCAWSPDSSMLVVCHNQSSVRVVDTATWALTTVASIGGPKLFCSFSPDGQYVAFSAVTSAPYFFVLRTSDWTAVSGVSAPSLSTTNAWAPDGSWVICGMAGAPYYKAYETTGWTEITIPNMSPASRVYMLTFSPNREYLAYSTQASPYISIKS